MSLDQEKIGAARDVLASIAPLTVGIDENRAVAIHHQRIPRKQSKKKQQKTVNIHSPNDAEARKFSPKTDGFKHFLYCIRRLAMASPERTVAWNEIRNIYRKDTGRHLHTDELNLICGTSGLTKKQLICGVLSSLVEPVDSKCLILRFTLGSAAPTPSPVAGRSEAESGDVSPTGRPDSQISSDAALVDREAARQHIIEQLRLRGVEIAGMDVANSENIALETPQAAEFVELPEEQCSISDDQPIIESASVEVKPEVVVVQEEESMEVEETVPVAEESQETIEHRQDAGMECLAGDADTLLDEKDMSDVDVSLNISGLQETMEPATPQRTQELTVVTATLNDTNITVEKVEFDESPVVQAGDAESAPSEEVLAEDVTIQSEISNAPEEPTHVEHIVETCTTQSVTENVLEDMAPTPHSVSEEKEEICGTSSQKTAIEKEEEEVKCEEEHDHTDSEDIPYDDASAEPSRVNSPEKPVIYTTTITVELEPKTQTPAIPSTAHLDVTKEDEVVSDRVEKELAAEKQEETITPEPELEQRPIEVEQQETASSTEKKEKNSKHVTIVAPRKPAGRCCTIQ